MNEILHDEKFQKMESAWRGLEDLVNHTNFKADITIDMLDVAKEELAEDFENNSSNLFSSALFDKVYIQEYDQYGGKPFGAIIGLYDFTSSPRGPHLAAAHGQGGQRRALPVHLRGQPQVLRLRDDRGDGGASRTWRACSTTRATAAGTRCVTRKRPPTSA